MRFLRWFRHNIAKFTGAGINECRAAAALKPNTLSEMREKKNTTQQSRVKQQQQQQKTVKHINKLEKSWHWVSNIHFNKHFKQKQKKESLTLVLFLFFACSKSRLTTKYYAQRIHKFPLLNSFHLLLFWYICAEHNIIFFFFISDTQRVGS